MIIYVCMGIVLVLIAVLAFDFRLRVRSYGVNSPKVSERLRIALVTDLHSCRYGKEQNKLIREIDVQKPDAVLLGGDIFDNLRSDRNTEAFIKGIAGHYPCFYVTGNHEYYSDSARFAKKMGLLEKYGITVLSGECQELTVHGETIRICGVDDPDIYKMRRDISYEEAQRRFMEQVNAVGTEAGGEVFTVLLSHRPEYFTTYVSHGFDLVLCGHAHGGQWRIPGIQNGLFAPYQGFFPKYSGGRFNENGTVMIVSRGLARESLCIPRVFNRPELVFVDII